MIVLFNALTITVLQVPVTRGVSSPLRAARTARLAGAALALSCVLFALSQGRGGTLALLVLFAAATVHVAGELLFVAASWRLSVDLMPADAPAQYQGVFATGQATAQMIAPAVMTTLVIGWSAAGWLVLASVFTIAVLPAMPATRWALRTRRTQATAIRSAASGRAWLRQAPCAGRHGHPGAAGRPAARPRPPGEPLPLLRRRGGAAHGRGQPVALTAAPGDLRDAGRAAVGDRDAHR